MHTVKPLDVESLLEHASRVAAIVVIEEHNIIGGLGGAVAEVLAETGFDPVKRFKRIGIPDIFPRRLRLAGEHDGPVPHHRGSHG